MLQLFMKNISKLAKMCGIEDSDDSVTTSKAFSIRQEMAFYTTNIKNAEPTIEIFWKKYGKQLPLL